MVDYSRYETIKVEKSERVATVTHQPSRLAQRGQPGRCIMSWIDLARSGGRPGRQRDSSDRRGAGLLRRRRRQGDGGGSLAGLSDKKGQGRADAEPIAAANGRRLVENMLDVEQPIIGAINGDAVGLGATLALLCDITVVSEKARFADTHVKVGVVAGDGGAVIWPLLIGPHRAKEFLMRGNFINGAEAGRIGMVNYAVPPEQVMTKARELAQELADGPTWAIRWSKLAVNKWLKQQANLIMDAGLAYEMMTFNTKDQKEAARRSSRSASPSTSAISQVATPLS